MAFIVDHFVQCVGTNSAMLRDACEDFPLIGVELIEAVAARLASRGAGSLLSSSSSLGQRGETSSAVVVESKMA